jgi:hypothetical protein
MLTGSVDIPCPKVLTSVNNKETAPLRIEAMLRRERDDDREGEKGSFIRNAKHAREERIGREGFVMQQPREWKGCFFWYRVSIYYMSSYKLI